VSERLAESSGSSLPRTSVSSLPSSPSSSSLPLHPAPDPAIAGAIVGIVGIVGIVDDGPAPSSRVVRVLPDEAAIGKVFDYSVPPRLPGAELIAVGTEVRIELHGRRVGGWVLAVDVEPPAGVTLRPIAKVRGIGSPQPVVDLAMWAAWRWGGRAAQVLRFTTAPTAIRRLPKPPLRPPLIALQSDPLSALVRHAVGQQRPATHVIQTPPTVDRFAMLLTAVSHAGAAGALIVVPSTAAAEALGRRMRRTGVPTAVMPNDWAMAAAGGVTVIGARAAVFAPIAQPGIIVVVDEHDEAHQEQRTPSWHARDVAIERARRVGVPCLLTSPTPTLEAQLAAGEQHVWALERQQERQAWPPVVVVDRSTEEPGRAGLITPAIVQALRTDERVLCVLNRTGRARMLACVACGTVAECETCGASVHQPTAETRLVCPRCDAQRPIVCTACGGGRMKNLRMGTSRAREELEALALRPVGEVVADTETVPDTPVLVGTEALLHRVDRASSVIFLDIDSELFAPRHRAQEHALVLIARAARLVASRPGRSGRSDHGRIYLQTRTPNHPVIQAAVLGDPARVSAHEGPIRTALRLPPDFALAVISGEAAPQWVALLKADSQVEISSAADGKYLLRTQRVETLCDAIAAVDAVRPPGRVRIEIDPLRI
jgi:primosomal protein N' (replication factor Y) (superfamily II helicase)